MAVIFVPNFLKIQRKEDEYVDERYLKSRGQKGIFPFREITKEMAETLDFTGFFRHAVTLFRAKKS